MPFFKRNNKNEKEKEFTYIEQAENKDMDLSVENLKSILTGNEDVLFRDIRVNGINVTLLYVDGLINSTLTSDYILKPLTQEGVFKDIKSEKEIIKKIQEGNIYYAFQNTRDTIDDVLNDMLGGSTVLVFNNEKKAITFSNKGFEKRSISEPTGENVIKGSKDAFVETLRVNTATIRRRIKSQHLRIESTIVGQRTMTTVDIIYMDGIANKFILEELRKRLKAINKDVALTVGDIEEYITDHQYTAFPQTLFTERPDKFCANIVGRWECA